MTKPSRLDVLDLIRNHFGLSMAEAVGVLNTPTHPAGLRDEFACRAMQGMLAADTCQVNQLGKSSYLIADAMMEARKQ